MKSVFVEWLLSEKPESHKKYATITYNGLLNRGLTSINNLIVDIIRSYSSKNKSLKRISMLMGHMTPENVIDVNFPYWLFFSICVLNLNNQTDSDTVLEILNFDGTQYDSPNSHVGKLRRAFRRNTTLQEKLNQMSKCVAEIENQMVIIELKKEIKTKVEVPRDVVLVSYSTWMDQDGVFKTLFPDDDDDSKVRQRLKRKRQQSECSSSAKGKGAKAKGKEAKIQWDTIITDFPLYGKCPLYENWKRKNNISSC